MKNNRLIYKQTSSTIVKSVSWFSQFKPFVISEIERIGIRFFITTMFFLKKQFLDAKHM